MTNVILLRPAFNRQVEHETLEIIRATRRKIAECRQLRAEAERVRRGYVERRMQIERMLAQIEEKAERECVATIPTNLRGTTPPLSG